MKAFSLAALKLVAILRDAIEQATVYDEVSQFCIFHLNNLNICQEDFQSQAFGFDLASLHRVVDVVNKCSSAAAALTSENTVRKEI